MGIKYLLYMKMGPKEGVQVGGPRGGSKGGHMSPF